MIWIKGINFPLPNKTVCSITSKLSDGFAPITLYGIFIQRALFLSPSLSPLSPFLLSSLPLSVSPFSLSLSLSLSFNGGELLWRGVCITNIINQWWTSDLIFKANISQLANQVTHSNSKNGVSLPSSWNELFSKQRKTCGNLLVPMGWQFQHGNHEWIGLCSWKKNAI